ncbi:MAG: FIVAR domain-containing protein [Clostridia bacterium]|nr:FIVAR domain-containing protein [Clostridia bacterium]
MKKIISTLILTALLLSSILAIVPVAAEEAGDAKVNVLLSGGAADHEGGTANALFYNYPLYNFVVGTYPISGSDMGNTAYTLRSVNNATGGSRINDGKLDNYSGAYNAFSADGVDITDNEGTTHHFDGWVGISLRETKKIDSFSLYTLNDVSKGDLQRVDELALFGAVVNPETHTFDANSWFMMTDLITDVQSTSTEDGNLAFITGALKMPFEVDYIFMAVNCEGEAGVGGKFNIVEIEAYEFVPAPVDLVALNAAIEAAESELAKTNTYTTDTYNALNKAYESAKTVRETAPGQAAIDYAAEAITKAIAALATLADYSDLSAELAKHADKLEADYTSSTWAVFAAARDAANTLIETGNTSEQAVAEHLMALMNAADALTPKASADSLAALKAKLEEAKALDSSIYTSQTVSALNVAMRDANALTREDVKDDVSLSQCEVAMKALVDALDALKVKADLSALQAILDDALKAESTKYTEESFSKLAAAITAAQVFLTGNTSNVTAEEATALGDAITAAKAALVELADFTALNAKIAEAEALKEADYSAETWKALKDAVAAAKALTAEATQKQADDALAAVEAAIKALAAPAATEPATEKPADNSSEGGCGGVIGATAVVITAVLGLGVATLRRKDN